MLLLVLPSGELFLFLLGIQIYNYFILNYLYSCLFMLLSS